jgi:ribosomal protein S6
LNTQGKEEALQETIDKISTEISTAGGKVETVQKMERKNFMRIADKKHSTGFYVNVIFSAAPNAIAQLRSKFALNEEIFRSLLSLSPEPKPAK